MRTAGPWTGSGLEGRHYPDLPSMARGTDFAARLAFLSLVFCSDLAAAGCASFLHGRARAFFGIYRCLLLVWGLHSRFITSW